MEADEISFFRIGRDGLTAEMRRSGRAWKKLVAEFGESVYFRPAVARAVASDMQPQLCVGRYLGFHARTGSILIMTTEGVVKAAGLRRLNEENRCNVENWNALRRLSWDVTKRGQKVRRLFQAPRLQIIHLPLTTRRRYVTRADLRKNGVTQGCSACSDIAVHGKTSKPHTEEWRSRIGEQMVHDSEGHEPLQAHERRRDVEHEIEANREPVAGGNDFEPAPQEQQDVEMAVEAPAESASVKRGSDAVADNEERARLRLSAEGQRGQKHDVQDVQEPQAKTRARLEPRWVRSVKAHNLSQIWRKRSRQQFKEARARVLMVLLILLWLRA